MLTQTYTLSSARPGDDKLVAVCQKGNWPQKKSDYSFTIGYWYTQKDLINLLVVFNGCMRPLNPKRFAVLLGMDPISRRHLWDLIASVKQSCAIMLTTHSMEEADILGDRIGIMARGQLCCLGSGLHLKQKFGSGYRLSVQVQQVLYIWVP